MTLYLTEKLNFRIGKAGIVMAVFGAGAVCGGLLGGKLTDKIGFYPVQLCALIIGGIMFMILGQMTSFTTICICAFILSIINDSFRPANAAAVAQYSKEESRTRAYSLNRLAVNLGWAVGGALGGFVASRNYQLLFWIDGVTNIGAALLLMAVLAPTKNKATPKGINKQISPDVIMHSAYRDKPYMVFIVLTMLQGYCFFQQFSTIPVYYRSELHLSEQFIGMIMALNGLLITLFEMVVVAQLEGKRRNLYFIVYGTILMGLSFISFNILPGAASLALMSMLIITMGEILAMPFMNSFGISRSNETNRGQYAGLYTVAWSTAQVLGPGTGSQVAQYLGFRALWWFIGGLSILAAIGFKWLNIRLHKHL